MICVCDGIGLRQSKVPRDILSLEVAPVQKVSIAPKYRHGSGSQITRHDNGIRVDLPRLRSINLSPLVHDSTLQCLLGGNPVVGTCTKTHALVEVFRATEIVKPVWQEPFRFSGDTSQVSSHCVRGV
jgi:hypothetical protein